MTENNIKIEIDVDDYINLLNERRDFIAKAYNWKIPDCLWDYFCEIITECGIHGNTNPNYVVDNAVVNGDFGNFDEYKDKFETDENFINRVHNNTYYINTDERIICFSI